MLRRSKTRCQPGLKRRGPVDRAGRASAPCSPRCARWPRSGPPRRGRCRPAPASSPAAPPAAGRGPRRVCALEGRVHGLDRLAPRSPRSSSSTGVGRARSLGRGLAGAPAEDEQVGQRVAAEAVGAVQAGRAPRRRRRAPASVVCADVGVDADAAHDVVHRRPDLHRPGRDVDVGQLLELVVHRGQLARARARRGR